VFDEVHGSDGRRNLAGAARAGFLAERFGAGGFDYVGARARDLPVWALARRVVSVAATPATARAADAQAGEGADDGAPLHLAPAPEGAARLGPWLKALRPHQWIKNLLVLAPLLADQRLDPVAWAAAATTLVAFCMVASSAYLINDLLDLEADRAHPVKRARPFAAGLAPVGWGAALAVGLLAGGLGAAALVSPLVFGVIDICLLAGLYTLRVIAGAVAVGTNLSPWMLAFSTFLFLALAAMKRQSELVALARAGPPEAGAAGRAYRAEDLPVVTMMAIAAGYTAVLVLALYIYAPGVRALYASPMFLWGAPPILLYWVSRMVMIAHRGGMPADPVLFALRDRVSIGCLAGVVAVAAAARLL
jgi:4-hydroxybenzoate polyprenyltransferase